MVIPILHSMAPVRQRCPVSVADRIGKLHQIRHRRMDVGNLFTSCLRFCPHGPTDNPICHIPPMAKTSIFLSIELQNQGWVVEEGFNRIQWTIPSPWPQLRHHLRSGTRLRKLSIDLKIMILQVLQQLQVSDHRQHQR